MASRIEHDLRKLALEKSVLPFDLAERLLALKRADRKAFAGLVAELATGAGPGRGRGLSRRRLLYLVSMAENLPLSQHRKRLRAIGWTKASVIAAFVKENGGADTGSLLDLAERLTAAQLRVAIASGDLVDGMRCVQLRLTPDQYARFSAVMIQHGATPIAGRGLKGQEEALMLALQTAEPKQQP